MEKKWFGVRTFNGYEQKVIDSLKAQINKEHMDNLIGEIYLPTIQEYSFVRNQLKRKERLLYPGYIFVQMENSNEAIFFVRGIQYVTGYSGISSMKEKPSPMEDDEITVMKNVADQIGIELNVGDTVIVEGHDLYDGQQLRVVSIDPQNEKIELEVNSLLGYDTAPELFDFDQIRKTK